MAGITTWRGAASMMGANLRFGLFCAATHRSARHSTRRVRYTGWGVRVTVYGRHSFPSFSILQ